MINHSHRHTPAQQDSQSLVGALERLADELHVVRDVLSEIREDLNWIVHNERSDRSRHSVLKAMALDPTADDWGEKLQIVRGPHGDAVDAEDRDDGQLRQTKEIVSQVLSTTEMSLDALEDETQAVVEKARRQISDATQSPQPGSKTVSASKASESSGPEPGRLF